MLKVLITMPDNAAFTIRPMISSDLDEALKLSTDEGWNQTMNDWKFLLGNSENVCIVADKDGILAGTATALNFENRIAWIGMVLVNKSFRGLGAGKMLLEHITGKLRHIGSVKLDATPAGEPLYKKLGFLPEFKILRLKREAGSIHYPVEPAMNIKRSGRAVLKDIILQDRIAFGADRSYLLNNLLVNYPDKAFHTLKNDQPDGYLFGRDGSRFDYIGPVIAHSTEAAVSLITKALESTEGRVTGVDVPEFHAELIEWLESIGFVLQRKFVRMYLNINPYPGVVKRQYLIAGPEYG